MKSGRFGNSDDGGVRHGVLNEHLNCATETRKSESLNANVRVERSGEKVQRNVEVGGKKGGPSEPEG